MSRDPKNVFHLAIPCKDVAEAEQFYVDQLGCDVGRKYNDRVTLNYFGDQVVCHLAPDEVDQEPKMYPRHFGVTFRERGEYDQLLDRARHRSIPFFRDPFVRFPGKKEEHHTFFLVDPSNNLLEFKWYQDPSMMY